jgi:hypothetical protein
MDITDAAFAITPHLVAEFARLPGRRLLEYVVDVGVTESCRQVEERIVPEDLAPAYNAAVASCRRAALDVVAVDLEKIDFRYALAALGFLLGHPKLGDILFHLDCISADCPKCGASVAPEEIQGSGYV